MDVFDSDDCSDSSSSAASPVHSPVGAPPALTEAEFLQLQREQLAYQREMRRILVAEKEMRRRQAEQDQRRRPGLKRRTSSGKKVPKVKVAAMTTITEAE